MFWLELNADIYLFYYSLNFLGLLLFSLSPDMSHGKAAVKQHMDLWV